MWIIGSDAEEAELQPHSYGASGRLCILEDNYKVLGNFRLLSTSRQLSIVWQQFRQKILSLNLSSSTDNMLPGIAFICMVAVVSVTSITAQTSGPVNVSSTVDIKTQSKGLVTMVRGLVTGAKEGTPLARLQQNVLDLQNYTSGLLVQLPGEVSECSTEAIIKMAAAAIGSHEVLNAMLAKEPLGILSARIDLCLAMMSQVVQQLEGQLTLSSDVSAYLAALIFATNTTNNVIETADKALKEIILPPHNDRLPATRVRRQVTRFGRQEFSFGKFTPSPFDTLKVNTPFPFERLNIGKVQIKPPLKTSLDLGKGFSLGFPDGFSWKSPKGNTQISIRPMLEGVKPKGVELRVNFKLGNKH